jgi:penicillin amidase
VNGFWHLFSRSTPRILDAIAEDDSALLDAGARVERERADGDHDVPAPLDGWRASTSWNELLVRALDRAGAWWDGSVDEGPRTSSRGLQGPDRRNFHRLKLQHPLGVIPGVARIANRGPFPVPGDPDTVWQTAQFNNPANPHAMVGPSHRHVVDMADVDRSVAILCGGQSGHPASPHYSDQISMWRTGAMRPAPFTRPAIEAATRFRQIIAPR